MISWLSLGKELPAMPPFRAVAMVGTYQRVTTPPPLPLLFLHSLFSNNSRGIAQDADGMKAPALLMTANECTMTPARPSPPPAANPAPARSPAASISIRARPRCVFSTTTTEAELRAIVRTQGLQIRRSAPQKSL
jgi:hypothetical protein